METLMPIKNIKSRNHSFDFLKAIFAIGVIFVHFPFPGITGKIFSAIGVCGVIFFFLISGYSAYNKDDNIACNNIIRRFKKYLIITIIVVLIYFAFKIIESAIAGEFSEFLASFKNPWLFPRMIILGDFSFIKADQLWFMVALLYSYLIFYLLHKFKITKYAYYILPLLLFLRIGMETYVNSYNADWHYSGNFLVGGLPIMLLGHYIAYKKNDFFKSPIYLTAILTIIFTTFMFITVNVKVFDLDVSQLFKILCMLELFLLTLKIPGKKEMPVLGILGRKYSLYIYLFHFLIGIMVYDVMYLIGNPEWVYDWIGPILAATFGIFVSILLYEINTKIKTKMIKQ